MMVWGGFTPRPKDKPKTGWDPITDIARFNCECGKWIVLPPGFTGENPFTCEGLHESCGHVYFWKDGEVKTDER